MLPEVSFSFDWELRPGCVGPDRFQIASFFALGVCVELSTVWRGQRPITPSPCHYGVILGPALVLFVT